MNAAIKATVATLALLASGSGALAEVGTTPVTVATFVRAESDHMIRANMEMVGVTFGEFVHLREPTTPDNQPVIRMNQDTLYSATVLDLSKPVTITLPEIGGRYMSMHVVNQDHYCFVEAKPGTYELTEDTVGTRFAYVTVRTFYNAGDPDDLAGAHAAQDRIEISGGGPGPFVAPNWDTNQLAIARQALGDLGKLGFDTTYAFGSQGTGPAGRSFRRHGRRLGRPAAHGRLLHHGERREERRHDAARGHCERRAGGCVLVHHGLQRRRLPRSERPRPEQLQQLLRQPNEDGSYTIHFGGDPKGGNYLPITKGWNYAVRMYQPRQEILDGTWKFPAIEPVKTRPQDI
jgi:hypothetical protein